MPNESALKSARKTIDAALKALDETRTELIRVKRELTEQLGEPDPEEVPTVRPPSTPAMEAVKIPKVEVVRIPGKGRYG